MVHQILSYLLNLVISHWSTVLAYTGAGGGVSVLLQFLKKLRKWESGAWIQLVLGIITTATAASAYIIRNYTTSPLPTIFGNFAPKILVAALVVYHLAVSPLSKYIEKNLVPFFTAIKSQVAQLKAEKTPPTPPVDTTTSFS